MSNHATNDLNNCSSNRQSFPAQPCLLCAARSLHGPVCADCAAALPRLADGCPLCAAVSPAGEVCGRCLKRPPAFDRLRAVYRYEFPVDVLVRQLKYAGELACAGWLAGRLTEVIAAAAGARPEVIVPMPLHPRRLRERGFNQAVLLARRVGAGLRLPVLAEACRRLRDTPPQVGLSHAERRRNLRAAFACDTDLSGRRVALLDDVMTSGASLDALAGAVRRAGAVAVEAWAIARTP